MNPYTERQDRMWNELSDESKRYVLARFKESQIYKCDREMDIYIDMFGEHNLNTINTWDDYVRVNGPQSFCFNISDESYRKKIEADYKIAKLIETAYGGLLSDDEWAEFAAAPNADYCCVVYDIVGDEVRFDTKRLLSSGNCPTFTKMYVVFRDRKYADRFLKYPENLELLKDAFMIHRT